MMLILPVAMFVLLSLGAEGTLTRVPLVAFLCNRPAMHLTENGWVSDESTNCLRNNADILSYCRKIYPTLTIKSVALTGSNVAISNWCHFGHHKCSARYSVRPFRCVVSDATQTPPIVSTTTQPTTSVSTPRPTRQATTHVDKPDHLDAVSQSSRKSLTNVVASPRKEKLTGSMHSQEQSDEKWDDEYRRYLSQSLSSATDEVKVDHPSEHENYERVMADLERRHRSKVAKLMKEWAMARQRVQQIKETDGKGADKFNKEITARFQKAYESLERDGARDKTKVITVHHDRVQAVLDQKRDRSYEHFTDAINERRSNPSRIIKTLTHYVKTEQKDRLHAIKHYRHAAQEIEETSKSVSKTDDVERLQEKLLARLEESEERVQRTIRMIDRLPEVYEKEIRTKIDKLLSSYPTIKESMEQIILASTNRQSTTHGGVRTVGTSIHEHRKTVATTPYGSHKQQSHIPTTPAVTTTNSSRPLPAPRRWTPVNKHAHISPGYDAPHHRSGGANHTMASPRYHHQASSVADVRDHVGGARDDQSEHNRDVTNRDVIMPMVQVHAAHVEKNDLVANEIYIRKTPMKSSVDRSGSAGMHVAAPLGVAIAGATVIAVLVIGVTLLRQRGAASDSSTLRCPQEDVVKEGAAQQTTQGPDAEAVQPIMNGYENPTYRYYEAKV